MFKNYFTTAIRNLKKNKFFTTLNIFGLAVGLSLSLLFVAMVIDHASPGNDNSFIPNAKGCECKSCG